MIPTSEACAFIAGAGGAIGEVLCRLLVRDGWRVVGTTRSSERAQRLRALGVEPVVVDVYDRDALVRAVGAAAPQVVVHQLTDLPKVYSAEGLAAARAGNARVREVGTAHLVDAAVQAGAQRLVAQSIGFAYRPTSKPVPETAPLDLAQYDSVATLERLVLGCGLTGVVLRYGRLYGPNTWTRTPPAAAPVHVDAAAHAARLAMIRPVRGVFNVAEDDGELDTRRARLELGWDAAFREANA